MTFWSDERIRNYGRRYPAFISPFNENQIDCNSYRLKMGDEYYCTSDAHSTRKRLLVARESFYIKPGQFAFLLSKEYVSVPPSAMAFISMRAKIKFRGLINVSGFHVDPEYHGKLIFSVFNAGPSAIHISNDEEMFLIWFADIDDQQKVGRKDRGYDTIPNDLVNGMNRELVSLYSLSKEITDIKFNQRVQALIFGTAVTIFTVILAGSVAYLVQNNLLSVISRKPAASVEVNVSGQNGQLPNVARESTIPRAENPQK